MTHHLSSILFTAILSLTLTSCWDDDQLPDATGDGPFTASLELKQDATLHSFSFNGYAPLAEKPITVFYYIPQGGNMTTMPVLFILPGEDRDADNHVQLFRSWADSHRVMLFGLKYSTDYFTNTTEYILGGMNTRQSADGLLPMSQWNFNYVEALFDAIKTAVGGQQTSYDLWGHSAGAQFVHRYVTFMPQARVRCAVACNSGWYTPPDMNTDFPYGLRRVSEADASMLRTALSRQFHIFVGGNDTDPSGLNTNPGSQAQGANRNARGHYYYDQAKAIAQQQHYSFGWTLTEVPGVGHDAAGMARGSWHVFEK